MIKKKSNRKIEKKDILNMKKLRKKGLSYSKISLELRISYNSIIYHLNELHREKVKKINRERGYTLKSKEHSRKYQKERYAKDPEFREKQKERSKKYQRDKK